MKKSKLLEKLVKKLVDASFKDGKLLESAVVRSIKMLKSESRGEAIVTLSEYLKELKRKERQFTMFLETAIPISSTQLKKAKKIVERKHKITKVSLSVNPQILGGFKLRIGDEIWDESISGKINQIKEAILSGGSN